jgi:hypothetical protein
MRGSAVPLAIPPRRILNRLNGELIAVPVALSRGPVRFIVGGTPLPTVVGWPGVVKEVSAARPTTFPPTVVDPPDIDAKGCVEVLFITAPSAMLNALVSIALYTVPLDTRYGPAIERDVPDCPTCENIRSRDPPRTEPAGGPVNVPPVRLINGLSVVLDNEPPSARRSRFPLMFITVSFIVSKGPDKLRLAGIDPPVAKPRAWMKLDPELRTVPPERVTRGSTDPVWVSDPPAKIPNISEVVVTLDPTALKSGPCSASVPGVAAVPDRFRIRPALVVFVKGSNPPRFTVLLWSWISGSVEVLEKFARAIDSK